MSETFNLKRIAIVLSLNCNLNCRLCAAHSPYYEKSADLSVSEQMSYIKRYFEIVDHVELFTISGGEPLLYKNLPEFLDRLFEYSDRFDKLEIITNSTVVPSPDLLNSYKRYGSKMYRFLIDDYNIRSKVPEICSRLEKVGIPYVVRDQHSENSHCGGWVDFGKLDTVLHDENEAEDIFRKCAYVQKLSFCFGIYQGYMTPCALVRWRISSGNASPDEYIDLMDESLSVEEQRNKIRNIVNGKVLDTCRYCTGLLEDSPRFKPAEQLTAEEINEIRQFHKNNKIAAQSKIACIAPESGCERVVRDTQCPPPPPRGKWTRGAWRRITGGVISGGYAFEGSLEGNIWKERV